MACKHIKVNKSIKARKKLTKDLEKIFKLAIFDKDYKTAIAAKQMIGKTLGLFEQREISITNFTNEELDQLIKEASKSGQNG